MQDIILFVFTENGKEVEREVKQVEDWAAVQRVYKQTGSKRETARVLGISRNTMKKLLELKAEPKYKRQIYPSKLDPYKEQIIEWRCDPYDYNGTRIFRELRKRGYEGSIGPVYRFLKKVDEDCDGLTSKKATTRYSISAFFSLIDIRNCKNTFVFSYWYGSD